MEDRKALHQGHRERMRERFLNSDPSTFFDHEILEMLLYHALPRRDTNGIAHALIEEFGSLSEVLEAGGDRAAVVEGISNGTALFLSLIGEVSRRYAAAKLEPEDKAPVFDTPEKIVAFLAPRFLGLTKERAYLMLFDNGMHLLDCFHVGDGSVARVPLSMRRIADRAITKNAAAAILAHNHPGGLAIPSGDDRVVTARLSEALRLIEVPLLEHYIFSDQAYTTIINQYEQSERESFASASLLDVLQKHLRKENP